MVSNCCTKGPARTQIQDTRIISVESFADQNMASFTDRQLIQGVRVFGRLKSMPYGYFLSGVWRFLVGTNPTCPIGNGHSPHDGVTCSPSLFLLISRVGYIFETYITPVADHVKASIANLGGPRPRDERQSISQHMFCHFRPVQLKMEHWDVYFQQAAPATFRRNRSHSELSWDCYGSSRPWCTD